MTRDSKPVRHAFQLAAVVLIGMTAGIPNSSQAASWTAINAGLPAISVGVNSLVVDPVSPTTIYALTIGQFGAPSLELFRSMDTGGNWRAVSNAGAVTSLAIDPQNSSILYAGTLHGIIKSIDGVRLGVPPAPVCQMALRRSSPSIRFPDRPYMLLLPVRLECR
jgi:hypothetical protein